MSFIKHVIKCTPVHMYQSDEEPPSNYIDMYAYDWAPYPSEDPNLIKFVNVHLDHYLMRRPLCDRVTGRYTYCIAAVNPDEWNRYPVQVPGVIDRTYKFEEDLRPALPIIRELPTNMSLFIMHIGHALTRDYPPVGNTIMHKIA